MGQQYRHGLSIQLNYCLIKALLRTSVVPHLFRISFRISILFARIFDHEQNAARFSVAI